MTALRQAVLMSVLFVVILYIATEMSEEAIRWEFETQVESDLLAKLALIKADIEQQGFNPSKYPMTPTELVAYQGNSDHLKQFEPFGLFAQIGHFEDEDLLFGDVEGGMFQGEWLFTSAHVNGYVLTVGVNIEQRQLFYSIIEKVNFYVGIIVSIVILVMGAFFGVSMQRRLWRMSSVLDEVADGNLSVRINPTQSTDDLGSLENKIDSTITQLELLIHRTREFSANIAHDLKTPLSQLRIRLESALIAYDEGEDCSQDIAAALDRSDHIISIFEAFMRISQLEAGTVKARFQDVNLGALIQEVASTYEPVIEDSQRSLIVKISNPCIIKGDRILLFQLLANLIENSLHHTPIGTEIILSARESVLEVSDNGPGIPESEYQKVLQPLYRLEKSRTSSGSGLGLAMVNTIANLHGAKLSLSSVSNNKGLSVQAKFTDL